MALPYFYQPNIAAGVATVILSEETSKHCVQVLRMKALEQLQLTDGLGNLFTATITVADKRNCLVAITATNYQPQSSRKISMGISLLKNASRLEWFLEKATEMGVQEIVPLLCHRTEKQHFRFDRMQNILIAAMLQSKQVWLPVLHAPTDFATTITSANFTQQLIAHCEEAPKLAIPQLAIGNSVQLLIGPEGDFTPQEIALAQQNGYQAVSLGNTRLRTETAGVVAAALLVNA